MLSPKEFKTSLIPSVLRSSIVPAVKPACSIESNIAFPSKPVESPVTIPEAKASPKTLAPAVPTVEPIAELAIA